MNNIVKPWWAASSAVHDPVQRIDWGWQTDTRSHNSGYKNRGFCWLIVMTEYHHQIIQATLSCCSIHVQDSAVQRTLGLVSCHRMVVTTGDAPGVWPPLTGCWVSGPGCVIRVLASPGPARPAPAARAGPRTLHPQQTSWVSPVTRRAARIEDRYITQVSGETETRGIPAGILPYFLHFCILLICQYLLSADKHQPQSTKEALVNTAPIEY